MIVNYGIKKFIKITTNSYQFISSYGVVLRNLCSFEIRKSQTLINFLSWPKYFDLSDMGIFATMLVLDYGNLYIYCTDVVLLGVIE